LQITGRSQNRAIALRWLFSGLPSLLFKKIDTVVNKYADTSACCCVLGCNDSNPAK